jgi:hypothetical protein
MLLADLLFGPLGDRRSHVAFVVLIAVDLDSSADRRPGRSVAGAHRPPAGRELEDCPAAAPDPVPAFLAAPARC